MASLAGTISWHPGFHVANPAGDQLVLAGETESFLLQGAHFRELFLHVDGTSSIPEIISRTAGVGNQAAVLSAIDALIDKRLIVAAADYENGRGHYHSGFDAEPSVFRLSDGLLELRILSEFEDAEFLIQWAKQLQVGEPSGVVIADDYLDPRLSGINRLYRRQNRSWLLIKPTGKRPLIGPCFTPQIEYTPCWQCLAYRILQNQPVRRWLQAKQGDGIVRIPAGYEKQTVAKMLSAALQRAQKALDRRMSFSLQAVDLEDLSVTVHPVSRLPQCPCCGDSGLSVQRSQSPITLHPSPKVHSTDGGFRSATPLQTLERLRQCVSPITGIVGDLSVLPEQDRKGVPIYRSFFSKTPGFGCRPDGNDFMQISLGKGISAEQSKAGALCESLERHAAQYRGDEPQVLFPASDSDFQVILPHELACFSARQYRQFGDLQHPNSGAKYAVTEYQPDNPLHWIPAWSLVEPAPCYLPLTFCYANTPFEDERFSRFTSNGCAAGNTLEEALLQGFLELVERDAVAIWWYNKICRPPVSLALLPEQEIRLLRRTLADEWDYWVLDITHDFDIPVMVAVARHKNSKTYRLGFGCHVNPSLACRRSLTELCQLIAIKDRGPSGFDFDAMAEEPFLRPQENGTEKKVPDYPVVDFTDIRDDVLYCVNKAAELGYETLALDYTRPDIPLHTARVIVPGLCHIWPQFGNKRLYRVPVALGWHKTELSEKQLNPLPLLL